MHGVRIGLTCLLLMMMSVVIVPAVRAQGPDPGAPGSVKRVTEGTLTW